MHADGEPRWPVLEGGPVAVPSVGGTPWAHDGYRMHLAGHGPQLDSVRAGRALMTAIEHEPGEAVTLHADRVESHRARRLHDRWATALELPLFVWERTGAGAVSWEAPLPDGAVAATGEGARVVLASRAGPTRIVFEAIGGHLRVGAGGRITWTSTGPSRLLAIGAEGDADLERSLDLVSRRTVDGLGRQRLQHAEQLHRGGAAMRSSGFPGLADAYDWAKVRGDALLGSGLDAAVRGGAGDSLGLTFLAQGMLAAGLSQLPRALRRSVPPGRLALPPAFAAEFDAWAGEGEADEAGHRPVPGPARDITEDEVTRLRVPGLEEIARGQLGGSGLAEFLGGAIGRLWGIRPDATRGEVTLAPDAALLGPSAALSRLRIGRTVLDVRFRRQGDLVAVALRRGAGPPIVVNGSLRGVSFAEVLLDGEPIAGPRTRFEVRDAHDVQFHLSGQPPLSSPPS